jgi:hypothetical protein
LPPGLSFRASIRVITWLASAGWLMMSTGSILGAR